MKRQNQIALRYEPSRLDTCEDFLLAIMAQHKVRSFEQVAILLGTTSESVRRYRRGASFFNGPMSLKVAELLEIDPELVLSRMEHLRAIDPQTKAVWERLAKKLQASMAEGAKHGFVAVVGLVVATAALGMGMGTGGIEHNSSYALVLLAFVTSEKYRLCVFALVMLATWATRPSRKMIVA